MIPSSGCPPWPPDHPRTLPRTGTPTPPRGARPCIAEEHGSVLHNPVANELTLATGLCTRQALVDRLAAALLHKRSDTVGEFAGLAESSTYVGKSARIVASIRAETGSLSFLAQP